MDDRRIFESDDGAERRHVRQIADEFFEGFDTVADLPSPAVSIFGSARVEEGHPAYEAARDVARRFAEHGFVVVTGGGPGVMEAANRGAKDVGARSFGATIDIGREPANRFVDKRIAFHYFFARKVVLVKYSYGFVLLPGGFGTLDNADDVTISGTHVVKGDQG